MQALRDHGTAPRRRWPWLLALSVVVLALAAGGVAFALTRAKGTTTVRCGSGSCRASGQQGSQASDAAATTIAVSSVKPATGATSVPSDTSVVVRFTSPVRSGGVTPSINPAVAGSWHASGRDELVFTPVAPFVPGTKYTVTVPGGQTGVQGTGGAHLPSTVTESFTVAAGSLTRLQQLLAVLGYLPLSYATPGVPAQDMAMPQPGTLQWRWSMPAALTDQWVQGYTNPITKGAIMTFETHNGLTVDGIPGPAVWTALLADVSSHKADTAPYTYVEVTKTLPEHLTAWVNGALQFANIPVNTGVPGATTADGTFQVFEHVRASHMSGTDITGTKYTITTVPWASYFNGGDALHGFVRAAYGFPQSNGCVEMRVTTAGHLWPYTPIGTLVTVGGPSAG